MKKSLLGLGVLAALASCRETNTSVKSAPSAEPIAASQTLCYDSTFTTIAQQPRTYSYTTDVVVGTSKTVTIPVKIDWTTVLEGGCQQVASLRVYQLGAADLRTNVVVKAVRDATCKPGPLASGPGKAPTGAVYIQPHLPSQASARIQQFSLYAQRPRVPRLAGTHPNPYLRQRPVDGAAAFNRYLGAPPLAGLFWVPPRAPR